MQAVLSIFGLIVVDASCSFHFWTHCCFSNIICFCAGDASLQTQPLQPLLGQMELFFEGRAALMQELAGRINTYYNTFCRSSALSKDEMLFIVLQGLAGVGKTRCLLEIQNQVLKCIKQDSALHKLYICGAVQNVYITFNGSGSGHQHPIFSMLL